jgi:hypothetical protein
LLPVAAANHAQRRADADEDESINHLIPENSRIAKLRAAKRHRHSPNEINSTTLTKIKEHD